MCQFLYGYKWQYLPEYVELRGHGCCVSYRVDHPSCYKKYTSAEECKKVCSETKHCKGYYYGLFRSSPQCNIATTKYPNCPENFSGWSTGRSGNISEDGNCESSAFSACFLKREKATGGKQGVIMI